MKMKKTGIRFIMFLTLTLGILSMGCRNMTVSASEQELTPWSFLQYGGTLGYFTSITTSYGEEFTEESLPRYNESGTRVETTVTAESVADGFEAVIGDNGAEKGYEASTGENINPYTLQVLMDMDTVEKGHKYQITFTASSTSRKYIYLCARSTAGPTLSYSIIALGTESETYTLSFTNTINTATGAKLRIQMMMGAFNSIYDYGGNDISDIVNPLETHWSGTVTISNFKVEDLIEDSETSTTSVSGTTSVQDITTNSESDSDDMGASKPAKVKIKSVKNLKRKKIKISLKKIKNVTGYQIRWAENKKFNGYEQKITTKKTYTIRKLSKNTKYYIKARAYVKKESKKVYGKWSKIKKITVRK